MTSQSREQEKPAWEREFETLQRKIAVASPLESDCPGAPVLIWTVTGGAMAHLEMGIFTALALGREGVPGLNVICDGTLSGCILHEATSGKPLSEWHAICRNCIHISESCLSQAGLSYIRMGDFVSPAERAEAREAAGEATLADLADREYQGIKVGLHAKASLVRYYRCPAARIQAADVDEVAREFLYAAIVNAMATRNAIERHAPQAFYSSHGLFSDWGPSLDVATRSGLRSVLYRASPVRGKVLVKEASSGDDLGPNFISESEWEALKKQGISTEQDAELRAVLSEYASGKTVQNDIFSSKSWEGNELQQLLGLSQDLSVWAVFLHNFWDFHLLTGQMVYDDLIDWVRETMEIIAAVDSVQWVIKSHPVALVQHYNYGLKELCEEFFPHLPKHITFVPSQERINNIRLQALCSGCVTIRGTAGFEMALQGKPTILAGEAHYGGKGFTLDVRDREHYKRLLRSAAQLPLLTAEQVRHARTYAYDYYVRRPVDVFPWGKQVCSAQDLEDRRMDAHPGYGKIAKALLSNKTKKSEG
ncbi:MAG: hypothetical protein V3573_04675 [Desulfovibrionaceae bacterium]